MKTCKIPNCSSPHLAKGLCQKHWAQKNYKNNRERLLKSKRAWVAKNIEKVRTFKRRLHYKTQFGITLEQYDQMLKEQGGRCKICGSDNPKSKRRTGMQVDHCHKTGKIRGLLCVPCNLGIGHLQDSPEILTKAIEYLCQK